MRTTALVFCVLVLGSALSLDLGTSLLSMDLQDIALLDTTSMSCSTPQNEFERVSQQMAAWADIVQHKDSLHRDIERLEGMKQLIEKKKFTKIEKYLDSLELPKTESKIGEPILAEFRQKLKGLSNPETSDECEATLLKLCIYLLKQFNSCRQQCQSNPVTVIKIKGKIKDLQIVQQGCGQPAPCEDEPGIPDEPVPEVPEEPTPEVPVEPTPETPVDPEIPDEEAPAPEEPVPVPDEEQQPPVPDEEAPAPPDEEQPPTPDEEQPTPEEGKPPVTPGEEEPEPETPEEEAPVPPEIPIDEQPEPEEETVTPPEVPPTPEEEQPENPEEETPAVPEEGTPEEGTPEEIGDEPPVNPNTEESPEEEGEVSEEFEEIFEEFEEFEEFEDIPTIEPAPEPEPEGEEVVKTCLNSVNEIVYGSSVEESSPLVNKALEGDDLSCYGFGFYARWLQAYPTYLVNGRQDASYFVARITENENVSGAPTDNALSVFLTREGFEFQSYDGEGVTSTTINVGDIEGEWVYVYYSYCNGKAVAVVNEKGQTTVSELNVSHSTPSQLHFQLAGPSGDVKSFQGQFRLVQSNVGKNVFIETAEEANEFVYACNVLPEESCERQISNLHEFEFKGKDTPFDANQVVENSEPVFAQEYSVSGWFKWYPVQDQASWHTAFRLTLNNVATNQNAKLLGDRDLALFVGNEHKDSILAFTTYTYTDLYGDGNPTYWQAMPYEKDLVHWHFIYFGYNRHISKAYAYVEFLTRKGEVHFENVKHFDAPHRYLYVGQDQFYPSYSGKIFNLHLNLCDGSYRELHYDEHWGYTPKPTDPVAPPPPEPVPEETPAEPEEEEQEWQEPPKPEIPEEPSEEEEEVVGPPVVVRPPDPVPEEEESPVVPEIPEEESPEVPEEESPEVPEEEEPEPPVEPEEEQPEPPVEPEEEVPEPPVEPEEEVPEPPVEPEEEQPEPPVEPTPEPPAPVPQPKCPPTIEVNKDNAADILCELSHYLGEFAQGHTPSAGPGTKKVCFCMTYNEDNAPPTLLQLASKMPGHLKLNEAKVAIPMLKKFIKQRQ